jgi:hypothetical protein
LYEEDKQMILKQLRVLKALKHQIGAPSTVEGVK